MEKTIKYAEIPQVRGGVAFSDPDYSPDTWCCYQRAFNPSGGWIMKMESARDEDGYVEFALTLGRRSMMSGLRVVENGEGAVIRHLAHHQLEAKAIGCDTARVFVGSLDCFERWGEEASIYTAADGLFANLQVVTCKGEDEPAGFLLIGAIDGGITSEDELFRTIVSAFDGHEIDRSRFAKLVDPNSLEIRRELVKELRRARAFEQGEKPNEKGEGDTER
ncbi:MAG: hypothetical protein IJO87_07125 [Eggerthellaceae bacterium]|nr:hypothetical protein [Eggerthellaceae bacterium]